MNTTLPIVLLLAGLAGLAIPVGGVLAHFERIHQRELRREVLHAAMSFGGGVLLAAVALVLVPEGLKELSLVPIVTTFLGGAVVFMGIDHLIGRSRSQVAQAMAMLLDFIPEAIALGAAFGSGSGSGTGPLLALLIGLQNLPEGFNAFRELRRNELSTRSCHAVLVALALLGPMAGWFGFVSLADRPRIMAGLMLFAAGGILYLMYQDIAPQARLKRHGLVSLGAVTGFLMGMVGHYWLM